MIDYLQRQYNLDDNLVTRAKQVYGQLSDRFSDIEHISHQNQSQVIFHMQDLGLSEHHFYGTAGYGYGDIGRELLDNLVARLMDTEDAIIRHHWVSGTHVIYDCLRSLLNKGDTLLSVTGRPYDTLAKAIGISEEASDNALINQGINYKEVQLTDLGSIDLQSILTKVKQLEPAVLFIQKSRGYSSRKSLNNDDIKQIASIVREHSKDTAIFVDNCYGEFVEESEPGSMGVDLLAGSLIKNPGGGLAPTGGYAAGKEQFVSRVAEQLTAPGLGKEMGATLYSNHKFLQGLYFAPSTVSSAVKGSVFCSALFKELGYQVSPEPHEYRSDIIQEISLEDKQKLKSFITGVQEAGVVDAHVKPEEETMPGYDFPVMMAAGTFIQGASLELSADAPVRPPYNAYIQGGLTFPHAVLGSMLAAQKIFT